LAKTTNELFNSNVISNYVNAIADLIRDDIQWNSDAMENLSIGYNGQYNHYTLEQFEGNLGTESILQAEGEVCNDLEFGLMELVGLRSDACKAATSSVDTSNNDNLSNKEIVPVYKGYEEDGPDSKLSHSDANTLLLSLKTSFIVIVIIEFLLYMN